MYISEGMRAALTPGVAHMSIVAVLATLVAMTAGLTWLGLRGFRKRAIG